LFKRGGMRWRREEGVYNHLSTSPNKPTFTQWKKTLTRWHVNLVLQEVQAFPSRPDPLLLFFKESSQMKKNCTPLLHTTTFPTLHHPQHHSTIVNFHLTAMIPLTLPIPTDRLSTHQISSAHASLHFIPPLVPPFSKHI